MTRLLSIVKDGCIRGTRLPMRAGLAGVAHVQAHALQDDFKLIPDFFNLEEQRILLRAALHKLDSTENRLSRKRRREYEASRRNYPPARSHTSQLFLPDEYYQFEEGHYDGVIRQYREMHLSAWPSEADAPGISSALKRLQGLYPSPDTQTHLLHLASDGEILPHVDNVSASGSWILGVSLGAERILRLQGTEPEGGQFDVLLPSGSVYIQRNSVRYNLEHSILRAGLFENKNISGGQRLSIMVRDRTPIKNV